MCKMHCERHVLEHALVLSVRQAESKAEHADRRSVRLQTGPAIGFGVLVCLCRGQHKNTCCAVSPSVRLSDWTGLDCCFLYVFVGPPHCVICRIRSKCQARFVAIVRQMIATQHSDPEALILCVRPSGWTAPDQSV